MRHRIRSPLFVLAAAWILLAGDMQAQDQHVNDRAARERPRAREMGIKIGVLPPGPLNAISDVAGVAVGHKTMIEGETLRTGVTVIVPHGGNVFQQKVPAAVVIGNGFGKLVGSTQVEELGVLETPIVLTNTLSTFATADALVAYMLAQDGNEQVRSINPLVAECNDGYLNDIRAQRVTRDDVTVALVAARGGPVAEGAIGAGTGMICMGWKGGIGTASRRLPGSLGGYTLGALVLSNFGGVLNVGGAPIGKELGRYYLRNVEVQAGSESRNQRANDGFSAKPNDPNRPGRNLQQDGSCIVVVATDAPLDARRLKRLARRALLGLAAVGSPMTHGSGDYAIAFSTAEEVRSTFDGESKTETATFLRDDAMSPLFQAAREACEEAVLNSLFRADTVTGFRGRTVEAIPIDRVREICRKYGVIAE